MRKKMTMKKMEKKVKRKLKTSKLRRTRMMESTSTKLSGRALAKTSNLE